MAYISTLRELVDDALRGRGIEVKEPEKLTKKQRLEQRLEALYDQRMKRIDRGRLQGGTAGGFNRDIDRINHHISLMIEKIDKC